jgi:hypothetical protein
MAREVLKAGLTAKLGEFLSRSQEKAGLSV